MSAESNSGILKGMVKHAKLLWVDLEMTGLDPVSDRILEVAAIATDWNFEEFATFEMVVHQPDDIMEQMNEWCVAQHGASGLTERVKAATQDDKAVEQTLITWAKKHFDTTDKILLAGNSIHMDRRFIERQWRDFDALLHYRMLDVSAWKVVFEGKYRKKFAKPEAHRALSDIRGSIEELKYYLGKVKAA